MVSITAGILALQLQVKWEPKTDLLPPNFVKAAQFLLNHGMPDPRGCELRAVTSDFIPFSRFFLQRSQGVGWVSSSYPTDSRPVISPFGISVVPKKIGTTAQYSTLTPRLIDSMLPNHDKFAPFGGSDPISFMLLAVHGEEIIVNKSLNLYEISKSHRKDETALEALQTYFNARFEQAVTAFQNEQDSLALKLFTETIDESADFEDFAPTIFSKEFTKYRLDTQENKSLFPLARDAKAFKADLVRRMSHPQPAQINPGSLSSKPIGQQVQILIGQLDQMGGLKDRQTRFGSYRANPSAERLYEIGKPAIPQLLQTLKNDDRLTRLEPTKFSSGPNYSVVSVKQVVQDLLCELAWIAPYRNMTYDQLSSYWNKYLDKPDGWRAYDLLSHQPSSESLRTLCAALFQDDAHPEYGFYFAEPGYHRSRNISVRPSVRAAKEFENPSVMDLLFRRISSPPRDVQHKLSEVVSAGLALDLGLYSYYWEPSKSLPALRLASEQFLAILPGSGAEINSSSYRSFDLVLDARKALGDKTYLHDQQSYADNLMTQHPDQNLGTCNYFINRIDDPIVLPLARKLLFDPSSGFQIQNYLAKKPMEIAILGSPVILTPEGKAMATKLFDDHNSLPESEVAQKYGPSFEADENGNNVLVFKSRYDRLRPCDLIARTISLFKGCPNFDLAWPQGRRDRAIPSVKRFFNRLSANNLDYRYPWSSGIVY